MSEQPQGGTGRWLKRITQSMSGEPRDLAELIEGLREASERGLFDGDALVMLEGVLAVADMQVRDIMVPRSEIVFVDEDARPAAFLPAAIGSGHSRFPVFDHEHEHVLGILLAKDLLPLAADAAYPFNMREIVRPVAFVPESKRLNILLREFRERRNHLAVVVDEYGGISGLVTIEDVIEQIVGEIDDEHDLAEEDNIRRHRDERYTVKARTLIEEFNERFGVTWSTDDYDTIGGLVIHELGHLPRRGEELAFDGFEFKVLRADRRRVRLVRVIRTSTGAGATTTA